MRKVVKLVHLVYYLFKFKSYRIAHFLAKDSFPLDRISEISVRNGKIIINKTGQAFSLEHMGLCRQSFPLFLDIAQHKNITLDNSGEQLYIVSGNTRIKATTFDNFFIAAELFIEGLYNLNYTKDLVVCDVGMNVGIASLAFADMRNVQKVYSFEPFPETFEAGLVNFNLNPSAKNKISPYNIGIGGSNADLEIPLAKVGSTAMSTTDFFLEQVGVDATHTIKVKIRDIKEIVTECLTNHPGKEILLKLDCEGAEYEIMEQLHSSGLLKKVRFLIIEWHFKGSETLRDTLLQNGFSCTIFPRPIYKIDDIGMIYAVNMQG